MNEDLNENRYYQSGFFLCSYRFWYFGYVLLIYVVIWCRTCICIYHWRSIFRLFLEEFQVFVDQFFFWSHCTFAIWFIRFVVLLLLLFFYFCWTPLFAVLIVFMVCDWYMFRLHICVCEDIWCCPQPLLLVGLLVIVIMKFIDSCIMFFICQFSKWQMFKCFILRCIIGNFYSCEIFRNFPPGMRIFCCLSAICIFKGVCSVANWQVIVVGVVT